MHVSKVKQLKWNSPLCRPKTCQNIHKWNKPLRFYWMSVKDIMNTEQWALWTQKLDTHGTKPLDGVIFILENIWDGHTALMVPCPIPIARSTPCSLALEAGRCSEVQWTLDARLCHSMPFWGWESWQGPLLKARLQMLSHIALDIISSHRIIAGAQVIHHSNGKQATIIESILLVYVDHIGCHNGRHWMKDETHLIHYAPICTGNGVQRVKQVHRPRRQKSVWDTSPMTRLEH